MFRVYIIRCNTNSKYLLFPIVENIVNTYEKETWKIPQFIIYLQLC